MEITTILLTATVGIIASIITAYVTTRLSMRQERAKWEHELSRELAELASDDPAKARRLGRQFAFGFLVFEQQGLPRQKVFIPKAGRLHVGRATDNDVILQDSTVSQHHAMFEVIDSVVFVWNFGSLGGVYVNETWVENKQKLNDGDKISIGKVEITFHTI